MNTGLYAVSISLLLISYAKDKQKTKMALKKSWKALENILAEFLTVILVVGILMAAINPDIISKVIGTHSGWIGVLMAAIVGSITLIPGFVAFPTASLLLEGGAGYMQIGAFVSSLMMVGVVTLPVEVKYFGRKTTYLRNGLAFLFSFIVAWGINIGVNLL